MKEGLFALPFAVATATSMSGGGLISIVVQSIVLAWDKMTTGVRRRWTIFAALVLTMYVVIDLFSSRNPFQVFVSYLTFSANSSFTRILIWQYASADVLANPIFGIGLGDWDRPRFMGPSVDNFWLATALRYGLPAFAFLAISILVLLWRMGQAAITDTAVARARLGIVTAYAGIIISGCTVHFWNATYCWVMFLFGLGQWVMSYSESSEKNQSTYAETTKAVPLAEPNSRKSKSSSPQVPSKSRSEKPVPPAPDRRKWLP